MNLLHFVGCFILGLIFYYILKGFCGCKGAIEGHVWYSYFQTGDTAGETEQSQFTAAM
jgi:hypothetical protein